MTRLGHTAQPQTQRRAIADGRRVLHSARRPRAGPRALGRTRPVDHVHPEVVAVMREAGIDLSAVHPTRLTEQLAAGAQLLITMGCSERCPLVPGLRCLEWQLPDPKGQSLELGRAIRDEIRSLVERLVAAEGWQQRAA